jgi:hypothetical protein
MNLEKRDSKQLAHLIVMLDLFRDELFEELLKRHGKHGMEVLRSIQNDTF